MPSSLSETFDDIFELRIHGEKGESLFASPVVDSTERLENYRNMAYHVEDAEGIMDERSYVLVLEAVVEYYFDELMKAVLPDYGLIEKFSISNKVKILRSMRLIPEQIIECAEIVIAIRNSFAHEIKLHSFERLDNNRRKALIRAFDSAVIGTTSNGRSLHSIFETVAIVAVAGFMEYRLTVLKFRQQLDETSFIDNLRKSSRTGD